MFSIIRFLNLFLIGSPYSFLWIAVIFLFFPFQDFTVFATPPTKLKMSFTSSDSTHYHSIAYYTSWCNYPPRKFAPWLLPVERLTHINYAFAKLVDNEIASADPWADYQITYKEVPLPNGELKTFQGNFGILNHPESPLRQRNPQLKTLISIGGWTLSKEFSTMAKSKATREKFIQSVLKFIQTYGFDGVDIDWEYPVEGGMDDNLRDPQDGLNFGMLLKELKQALQFTCPSALLTIATSASPCIYRHLNFQAIRESCDWVNIMTYDAAGAWSDKTGHHAPLYPFVHEAIQGYIAKGLPPSQLCLGLPFYGRGFANVNASNPGTPFQGVPPGTHEQGVFDFQDIEHRRYSSNESSLWQSYFDDQAKASYLYTPQQQVWVSYETPQSIQAKTKYVKQYQLKGVFFWEASQDPQGKLVQAIQDGFLSTEE